MKEMKRILALLLCLVMLAGILPANVLAAEEGTDGETTSQTGTEETTGSDEGGSAAGYAVEASASAGARLEDGETIYVLAGSDFQPTDASNTTGVNLLNAILDKVDDKYTTMDGFLFAGDYDYNYSASQSGKEALQAAVQAVYGTGMDEVYVQGNHDVDSLVGSVLTSSGANDKEHYGVFVINEKDYMWYNDDETTIKNTAANLETYLNAKRNAGYTQPIFVISHLPLHYCMRTQVGGGDGKHANYIFDVLNEAGRAGLNIIFMFGHNHSHGWDDPYGGAAIFLKKGDSINIAQNSTTNYNVETLNFTYMNAGYVSYYRNVNSGAETDLSMTVFAITNSDVTVERYTADGLHDLKSAGVANTHASTGSSVDGSCSTNHGGNETYSPDTSVVASAYTMTLNTEIEPTGEEIETPDSGTTTTQRTYTRVTSTSELVSGDQYLIFYNGSHFMLPEVVEKSDGSTRKGFNIESTSVCGPDTITGNYQAKEWVLTSSGSGWLLGNGTQYAKLTNTTDYKITATLETSGDVFTIGGSENAFTFSNGTYVLNYNDRGLINGYASNAATFYIYRMTEAGSGGTVDTTGGGWVTLTEPVEGGKYKYVLDENGVDTGVEYLIVANSYPKALSAAASSNNAVDIELSDDEKTAYATSDTYGWTFTQYSNGVYYIRLNGSTYLRYSNGALSSSTSTGSSRRWAVSSNGDGSYDIIYNEDYNLRWSNSNGVFQASSSNSGPVRLYKYDSVTEAQAGLYGKISGELTYNVAIGTSAADAVAAVKAGIDVLYHTGDESAAVTLTEEEENTLITWTLDSSYNGTTPGEYAVVIAYNGIALGTAKVVVPAVAIESYDINPKEGNVIQGSGQSAATGSTITVTLENGNYYTVPVTLSMLSKDGQPVSTAEATTLTGLKVTYNGVTIATDYTLNIVAKVYNDYPTYPDEGAVKVDKSATGIDFQTTGVARVELSASGVPATKGADVVVVIDTSSSMKDNDVGDTGKTRIEVLAESLQQMLTQFQQPGEDGAAPDISIAIIDFNGYFPSTKQTVDEISFTNSSRDNADYAKVFTGVTDPVEIRNTTLGANHFVAATSLNVTNIVSNFKNDNCKSGTNYDGALKNAYDLLAAKKEANGGEDRDQYVIFLSDGAPFRYNGFNNGSSKDTYDPWSNWLTGYWASAGDFLAAYYTNTYAQTYSDFYNGNGDTHPHRYAEAIKGTEGQPYSVVNVDRTANTAGLASVNGLGATIYSIGFGLADDGSDADGGKVSVATQQELINVISSGAGYSYPNVQQASELTEAFTQIVTDIRNAAYNARYVDTMGEHFNIQLTPTVTRASDNQVITLAETPKMQVRSYTIWTRAEYLAGNCTEDQIGDRKTNADGSYIYDVLEEITFNEAGTEAYSTKDSIGPDGTTIAAGSNILIDGVIYAANFWYNTNTTGSVTIDIDRGEGVTEYALLAESFYWYIGTLSTNEIALSYYVHLDGAMSGKEAGSYATNESAILYYDNYLYRPCEKATVSPVLAWHAANVSYAFYLVNSSGVPVNMDGTEVTFANRVTIVNPTLYDEVLLNVAEGETIEPLQIVANDNSILPSGYTLYDYNAAYHVQINSDATGTWTITSSKSPDTTYVTGHSDTEQYTKKTTASGDDGYDFTHTTVWFAVVWEPRALDDTVVIDYGLPVDIHVLTNDMFGSFGKLVGVAAGKVTNTDSNNKTNEVEDTTANGTYGVATVNVPDTGANEGNSYIRYTLNESNGMQIKEPEVFTYSVQYANTKLTENNGYYYGTVTVIPATTIYYEDSFVDLSTYTWDYTAGGWALVTTETGWSTVGEVNSDATQDEDRPGDVNYAFDTVIDANNVYGYDSAYAECSKYSLGSAAKVNVNYDKKAQASFSFWGTGFDVVSLTSDQTGTIIVDIYSVANGVETLKNSYVVDTYFGYTYVESTTEGEEGTWELTANSSGENALYQVPVIKTSGLTYGQYKVVVTAQYTEAFDHGQYSDETYDFYLDAIRIYDPAGTGEDVVVDDKGTSDTTDDITVEDIYIQDEEGWPVYQELRNNVIDAADAGAIAGVVFVDGIADGTAEVAQYKAVGPNNELYLKPGQAIMFTINLADYANKLASLQIGMKGETDAAVNYHIFSAADIKKASDLDNLKLYTLNTATDMYYDITELKDATIVIYNRSGGTLSITNLKATFTEKTDLTGVNLSTISKTAVEAFLTAINTNDDGTVEETTTPSTEGTGTGTGSDVANTMRNVISNILSRLKKWFGK